MPEMLALSAEYSCIIDERKQIDYSTFESIKMRQYVVRMS